MATINTKPIFPIGSQPSGITITAASTNYYGTDATVSILSVNGNAFNTGVILDFKSGGIFSMGNNPPTVFRLWINNGLDPSSAGNNLPIGEVNFPGTAGSNDAALQWVDIMHLLEGKTLPDQHKLLIASTKDAATGWRASTWARVFGPGPI